MRIEVEDKLKQAMNYTEGTECCAACNNFRQATSGLILGSPQEVPRGCRCSLNAIEICVTPKGHCKYFRTR